MTRKTKLNPTQVLAISEDADTPLEVLASRYDVHPTTIRNIKSGFSRADITGRSYERASRKSIVRISDEVVLAIFNDNETPRKELSRRYNVSLSCISGIKSGSSRSNITGKFHERKPKTRLKPSEVIEIYHAKGMQMDIAEKYNISTTTVYLIKSGRTWKNLDKSV